MSIEQQLAALIAALQENTAAINARGNVPASLQLQNPVETPVAAPMPATQAQTPAAPPAQEQIAPAATQTGTAPAAATTPIAAAPATPGVAAQPAAASPSDPAAQPAYGLNELRAEVLAKYNATNKDERVTDLVQRYGGGNVSAIAAEQYGNFLGELRAIA